MAIKQLGSVVVVTLYTPALLCLHIFLCCFSLSLSPSLALSMFSLCLAHKVFINEIMHA